MGIFAVSLANIPVDHFFASLSGSPSVWFSSLQLLPAAHSELHHPVGTTMHSSEKSRSQSWGWGQWFQVSSFLGFSLGIKSCSLHLLFLHFYHSENLNKNSSKKSFQVPNVISSVSELSLIIYLNLSYASWYLLPYVLAVINMDCFIPFRV